MGPATEAIASSRGYMLFSGPWSRYYVLDSFVSEHHALPLPRHANAHDAVITTCDARGGY
jgi:hypothetical protein